MASSVGPDVAEGEAEADASFEGNSSLDILSQIASTHAQPQPPASGHHTAMLSDEALNTLLLSSLAENPPASSPESTHLAVGNTSSQDLLSALQLLHGSTSNTNGKDIEVFNPAEEVGVSNGNMSKEEQVAGLEGIDKKAEKALLANAGYVQQIRAMMNQVTAALERGEEIETLANHYANVSSSGDQVLLMPNGVELVSASLPWFKWRLGIDLPVYEDALKRERYNELINHPLWQPSERRKLEDEVMSQSRTLLLADVSRSVHTSANQLTTLEIAAYSSKVDWSIIASSLPGRTPFECRIQWHQRQHPGVNRDKWSDLEKEQLRELAVQNGERDWKDIAEKLGTNRTPVECLRQYRSAAMERKEWTTEEDAALREAVALHGQNWQAVANLVGRTSNQCINRWSKTLKPTIKKGKWDPSEDDALRAAVAAVGPVWKDVAPRVKGRTDAQCRERWCNILDPRIKIGNWSKEEDEQILALRAESKSWSEISRALDGTRTDNHIMRRWSELTNPKKRKGGTGSRRNARNKTLAQEAAAAPELAAQAAAAPVDSGDIATEVEENGAAEDAPVVTEGGTAAKKKKGAPRKGTGKTGLSSRSRPPRRGAASNLSKAAYVEDDDEE